MFRGAITQLDPATCRRSPTSVPIYAEQCAYLLGSLRTQGQIHPAIVRPTKRGDTHPYEIVCGARRHFAIAYLRDKVDETPGTRPFLALIRTLSDAKAFALGDQDNRHRRDIPDYQRAIDYRRALETHFADNQGRMARSLNLSAVSLRRYLSLAALPEPIYATFGKATRVTARHAGILVPLLNKPVQSKRLLAAAAILAEAQRNRGAAKKSHLSPATVLRRLLEAANPNPKLLASHQMRTHTGATIAAGRLRADGYIELPATSPDPSRRPQTLATMREIEPFLCELRTSPQDSPFL